MRAFNTAWDLVKMPITYDLYRNSPFPPPENLPRYLYSGGNKDDDFRYFTKDPNVALGISLFGSAIPRKFFPTKNRERRGRGSLKCEKPFHE